MIEELLKKAVIAQYVNLLNKANRALFLSVLGETLGAENSRLAMCSQFIQHGNTTVLMHTIAVSAFALYLAQRYHISVEKKELVRGALLHDYFLYDWHVKSLPNSIHGYTHPRKAMRNASQDFDLSVREQNMILRHMFPLTPVPPRYKEGILLCLADKIVATRETIHRK